MRGKERENEFFFLNLIIAIIATMNPISRVRHFL
jgi:hypothetical protein